VTATGSVAETDEALVEYDVTTVEVTVKTDPADRATSTAYNRGACTAGGSGAELHRLIRASGYSAHSRLNGGYVSVSKRK
jgi:hypothetical protein